MSPAIQNLLQPIYPFLDVLSAHPYIALFAGMLIAGEVVLLPAIFLATTGRLDMAVVVGIAMIATLISDAFWYGLGRRFPVKVIGRLSERLSGKVLNGVEQTFNAGGGRILFMSKFVYGTRTLVQVLAGVHKMPLRSYLPINMAGVLAATLVVIALSWLVVGTSYRIDELMQHMEVAFLLFVMVTLSGFFLFSRMMKRRWLI
jgi:membrane protein DedA with SNARE-associated domain